MADADDLDNKTKPLTYEEETTSNVANLGSPTLVQPRPLSPGETVASRPPRGNSTKKDHAGLECSGSGKYTPNALGASDEKDKLSRAQSHSPAPMGRQLSSGIEDHTAPEKVLLRTSVQSSHEFPLAVDSIGPERFQKLKFLGKGAVGKVYLVLLKGTQKLYAMKVLTKEEMIKKNKVKRVITEREILATANHPFIVTMYASFQTNKRLCYIMDFCEGGEFFRILQKQPRHRLSEDAVRFYSAEVLIALEYLHGLGFIYRDLKPENILMRGNGHIALTDFDLSKQAQAVSPQVIQQQLNMMDKLKNTLHIKRVDSKLSMLQVLDSEPVLQTKSTSFVGTEEYIAPEVVHGAAQSAAVDWWTLGVLIYEMLTGMTPFKGRTLDDTFANIIKDRFTITWPSDVVVGHEAKKIVKELLTRDTAKRLGSVNGATDIKAHKFYKDINFTLIRNETPPIKPKIHDPLDMSQYDPDFEKKDDLEAGETKGVMNNPDMDPTNPFRNFDLRRDSEVLNKY